MWKKKKKKKYKRFSIELPKGKQQSARFKEMYGVMLVAISLFFIVSVASHNPNDATLFSYSSGHNEISNLAGWIGAHIAAILLYLLGSAVYALLASLIVPAGVLLSGSYFSERGKDYRSVVLRRCALFLPILTLCSAVLCAFYSFDITNSYPGGLIGSVIAQTMFPVFGFFGSTIFLWSSFWVSLAFLINRSLTKDLAYIVEKVGGWLWVVMRAVHRMVGKFLATRREKGEQEQQDLLFFDQEADNAFEEAHDAVKEAVDTTFWDNVTTAARVKVPRAKKVGPGYNDTRHPKLQLIDALSMLIDIKSGKHKRFKLPSLSLFGERQDVHKDPTMMQESVEQGKKLEEKLQHFGVKGSVSRIKPGPLITMFEYQPEIDSKISKITSLEDDLAMALSAMSIRTIAPIPGKNAVGFEIANRTRQDVVFADIIRSRVFSQYKGRLPLVLGVDVVGNPMVENLASMPHLLIGGTTGSGKSVGLNAMITSLLCRCRPEDMRLILIDPKRLEFAPYADIPHLLFPIVTNPVKATSVLKWVVQEMEERYERMAQSGARNLHEYQRTGKKMPYIVVVIDELADLMIVAGKDVEMHIVRIAQMARAAGIHMIVATQRPSVDVVTGLIKVNFPSRVSYRVSSKVDSRTILDQQGAEKLLGRGDMLFKSSSSPHLTRVHGSYISNQAIEKLSSFLREQQSAQYLDLQEILKVESEKEELAEELYPEVIEFLKTVDEVSISMLQREYRIGFNRSARIIQKLESDGYIAPAQGSKPRKVIRY